MNLLALDTSTDACTVAIQVGTTIAFRHEVAPRQHTSLLMPMIRELLVQADVRAADIDAVILGNGPGSFIGMRIGASVGQGICMGAGAGLVPVSSLAALAAAALDNPGCERVLVAQDARMNEVYLEGYERGKDGLPRVVLPVRLQPIGAIGAIDRNYHAAGSGWRRHPELWAQNRERLAGLMDLDFPHARELLRIGAVKWREGDSIPADTLEPAYVRDRVATPSARQGDT